jgi:hypothetical protein
MGLVKICLRDREFVLAGVLRFELVQLGWPGPMCSEVKLQPRATAAPFPKGPKALFCRRSCDSKANDRVISIQFQRFGKSENWISILGCWQRFCGLPALRLPTETKTKRG